MLVASKAICITIIVVIGATTACTEGSEPPAPSASGNPASIIEGRPYEPAVPAPEDFVAVIDNPYLPLAPGTRRVYEGVSEGQRERTVVVVTHRTKTILGIEATVVRDRVFAEGALVEDTFDWFAQDRFGNVWYLGEDTAEYEHGEVVTTAGSWQAGVDGAQPGVVMLGDPRVGQTYRQEYYEGEAEDIATVIDLGRSTEVPYGSFEDVLVTKEGTPLEPAIVENKFYAPGVGVVLERLVRGGHEVIRLVAYTTA